MKLFSAFLFCALPFVCAVRADDETPDKKVDPPAKEAVKQADKKPAQVCHVPYRLTPVYHLLVRAKVNGGGPLNFIIDTGCNVVIVTPDGMRQANTALKNGRIERLEFEGGVVIENTRCNVNVPAQVALMNRNNAEGAPLHGIVGMDILKRFKIDLDYTHHKMVFTPAALVKEEKAADKAVVAPLETTKSDHVVVNVKLNGKGPYRFLYDTGAPGTVVSPKLVKGGPDKQAIVEVMEIGSLTAKDVPVVVMAPPAFDGIDGIIGFPLIARYRTVMNFPKKHVLFEPGSFDVPPVPTSVVMGRPARLTEPSSGQTLGIGFDQDGGDKKPGLVIDKVVPDSVAAAAGLKVGDRLLVFDDTWIDAPADCRWAMNRVKAGGSVAVKIQRDGKDKVVTIRFKEAPAKSKEAPADDLPKKDQPDSKDKTSGAATYLPRLDSISIPRQARTPASRHLTLIPGDVP